MRWIHDFQLFLFDFDGLLVNTEKLHYLAYKQMCAARGVTLNWSFEQYCQLAHYSADGLRREIYVQYPELERQEPRWEVLYEEKKQAIFRILEEGPIPLMPGVEALLTELNEFNIPRCVVTNSPTALVEIVRRKNGVLNTIPHWVTREYYTYPKPDPEPYLRAIELYGQAGDKMIGFEDTPRGLSSLMHTSALPVLICKEDEYPEIPLLKARGAYHFSSFEAIPSDRLLS